MLPQRQPPVILSGRLDMVVMFLYTDGNSPLRERSGRRRISLVVKAGGLLETVKTQRQHPLYTPYGLNQRCRRHACCLAFKLLDSEPQFLSSSGFRVRAMPRRLLAAPVMSVSWLLSNGKLRIDSNVREDILIQTSWALSGMQHLWP